MLSLSCGGGASPSTPIATIPMPATVPAGKQRLAYETFLEKRAAISEQQKPALLQETQLDRALRNYDSVGVQIRPLDQTEEAPSALMEIIRMPGPQTKRVRKCKSLALPALPSVDLDEIEIPEMHEALCRVFCPPNSWSPAFAAPGDFTIKMDSVFLDNGEVCFRIAVMCCCARSICDGSRVKPASKRQYYVSYVERSQQELAQLMEVLSLQYLGHRLADKMPTHGTNVITARRQRALDEHGAEVIRFLADLMQISEIGFNGLVVLKEPVASNVRLRDFLGLALSFGDQTIVATSSCDARIEGQDGGNRPVLPSAWLDIDVNLPSDSSLYGRNYSSRRSPRDEALSRAFGRLYDNGTCSDFGALVRSNGSTSRSGVGRCVRFIAPLCWLDDVPNDGSFTVEISGVSLVDGIAKYAISVLSYTNGALDVTTVERRYSEFDELAVAVEAKIPSLQIRKLLPPKTFFRYTSASFLERRAAYLQLFLERALRLTFSGVLNQDIPITAEPNIREFLHLPSVEWIVVPWSKQSPSTKQEPEPSRIRPNFSLSPTTASELSPQFSPSPRRNPRYIPPSTPRYESLLLKRSDSM